MTLFRETFLKLVLATCKLGDVDTAFTLIDEMRKNGIQPDENIQNALVLGFSKTG